MFICPNCKAPLTTDAKTWRCENGHAFDVGKNGDVNLLLPQQKRSLAPGDSKAMVRARHDFLETGAYQPIAERLANIVTILGQGETLTIADAGCGEGYYLRHIKRLCFPSKTQTPTLVGWDISKFAVQAASKNTDFAYWLTASNAHIPLADNCVDVLLSLFGFEVGEAFSRIVKRDGFIVTADAGENHLIEIRRLIYPEIKPYRPKPALDSDVLQRIKQESVNYEITLNANQLSQLLLMTPHFFRAKAEAKAKLENFSQLTVTVDVQLSIYQRI